MFLLLCIIQHIFLCFLALSSTEGALTIQEPFWACEAWSKEKDHSECVLTFFFPLALEHTVFCRTTTEMAHCHCCKDKWSHPSDDEDGCCHTAPLSHRCFQQLAGLAAVVLCLFYHYYSSRSLLRGYLRKKVLLLSVDFSCLIDCFPLLSCMSRLVSCKLFTCLLFVDKS